MAFFLSNMLETHFLSTGAFEVTLNGNVLWMTTLLGGKKNLKYTYEQCMSQMHNYLSVLDVPIWSKLQSGYVPNIQELFQILDNHLKMNQVDKMNFPSP